MSPVTVAFVLDTSVCMNQATSGGMSFIDCAKSAVEHFIKNRMRDASCKSDTMLIVTCDEGSSSIRAVDKFPFTKLLAALKTVTAMSKGVNTLGASLKRTLDLLSLQRLSSGADTYGHGYSTASLEPTMVIMLADGSKETMQLPPTASLGSELSKQPFRWDQRVFTVLMRIPAILPRDGGNSNAAAAPSEVPASENGIAAMCEVTGGRALAVGSLQALLYVMETLVARLQPCAVISFEQILPGGALKTKPQPSDPQQQQQQQQQPLPAATAAACRHRLLTVRTPGIWPLPEGFRVEAAASNSQILPAREAQPTLGFIPVEANPMVTPGFPVDVYEVETCPINGFMMAAHHVGMPDSFCWQVCSPSLVSETGGSVEPFAYLRLKRQGNIVCLHVLPYNYPVLLKLLDQLHTMPPNIKMSPPSAWRQELERYCANIPFYYLAPLRTAFKRMGVAPQLIPDMRSGLPPPFAKHLKHLHQQAKMELEMTHSVIQRHMIAAQPQFGGGLVQHKEPIFTNAFDIPRAQLLRQVSLLTARLVSGSKSLFKAPPQTLKKSVMGSLEADKKEASRFSVPIISMGDYHEIAMKKAPLRNPYTDDEERNRQNRMAFGNPYKRDKGSQGTPNNMMEMDGLVDEAGEALRGSVERGSGSRSSSRGPGRRRISRAPSESPSASPGSNNSAQRSSNSNKDPAAKAAASSRPASDGQAPGRSGAPSPQQDQGGFNKGAQSQGLGCALAAPDDPQSKQQQSSQQQQHGNESEPRLAADVGGDPSMSPDDDSAVLKSRASSTSASNHSGDSMSTTSEDSDQASTPRPRGGGTAGVGDPDDVSSSSHSSPVEGFVPAAAAKECHAAAAAEAAASPGAAAAAASDDAAPVSAPDSPSTPEPASERLEGTGEATAPATERPVDFAAMWAGAFPAAPATDEVAEKPNLKNKRKTPAPEDKPASESLQSRPPKRIRAASRQPSSAALSGGKTSEDPTRLSSAASSVSGVEVRSGKPFKADLRGTQDPSLRILRVFHAHREGVIDMSRQLIATLNTDDFSRFRLRWAQDLLEKAQETNKHSLVPGLRRILRESSLSDSPGP